MKISELIALLEEIKAENGDIPVKVGVSDGPRSPAGITDPAKEVWAGYSGKKGTPDGELSCHIEGY